MKGRSLVIALVLALALVAAVAILLVDTTGEKGSGLSDEFTYDVSKFKKIDPALIAYRLAATVPTGFEEVRALAVGPDNRIYVAGDGAVRIFSSGGEKQGEVAVTSRVGCLAVDTYGTLYLGARSQVEVRACPPAQARPGSSARDAAGARTASWPDLGKRAVLTCLAVAGDDVFAADAGNREVLRCDKSGRVLARIGGFIVPSPFFDVAVAPDGVLKVANPGRFRIETYSPGGRLVSFWGKPGVGIERFSGCCNPSHFAILPDGLFVTSEKGLLRVKVHAPDGAFRCAVAGPDEFSGTAFRGQDVTGQEVTWGNDVAADRDGRVLVLDIKARVVKIFVKKAAEPPATAE